MSALRPAPAGFVDLRTIDGVRLEVGYHRSDNFTGAPLPGYGAPGAWLVGEAAARLADVTEALRPRGLGLVVYDAYRPRRASRAMAAWCEAHGMEHLLRGWVGRESRHSRGIAVDVGLAHRDTGGVLSMGTAWDAFEPGSHVANAVGVARVHRRVLAEAMRGAGFEPYWREWWHFERPLDPSPPSRDVPYGADEPDEGEVELEPSVGGGR